MPQRRRLIKKKNSHTSEKNSLCFMSFSFQLEHVKICLIFEIRELKFLLIFLSKKSFPNYFPVNSFMYILSMDVGADKKAECGS